MQNKLEDLRLLAAAVEHGSFTAAAHHAGTTQSRVSRAVARLEAKLGVVLVRRSPRHTVPTEAGRIYAAFATRTLAHFSEVEASLRGGDALAGPLSISSPPAVGRRLLVEPVGSFCRANPDIGVDWRLGARRVDLLGEEVDVAVRFGPLAETWYRARTLLRGAYHLVAAPGLADDLSLPSGLDSARTLGLHATHLRDRWPMVVAGEVAWVRVTPDLWADDIDALIGLAVAGVGVTMVPDFLVTRELESGELVRLTEPAQAVPAEVFVVTGPQAPAARASALVDHLVAALRVPHQRPKTEG